MLIEPGDQLKTHGVSVKYAIHPIAGLLAGHGNVLLSGANGPCDDVSMLKDMSREFVQADAETMVVASTRHWPIDRASAVPRVDADRTIALVAAI